MTIISRAAAKRLLCSESDKEKILDASVAAAPVEHQINALLAQADEEEKRFKEKRAKLMAQVKALRGSAPVKEDRDGLLSQLQEANQNLILATFTAQDMQAAAEAVNIRQREFLSMLAHELRNPMAPVLMAAMMMGKLSEGDPKSRQMCDIIFRQVSHMSRMVDDLVDASRVNSGKFVLQKRLVNVSEVIASAVETSQPFVDNKNQGLTVTLHGQTTMIDADPVRLAQVFSNLIINASKFTPAQGKIIVSAQRVADRIVISVKDNGIGIGAELQPFIFDLFTQGPRSLDRSLGGLGIGLALVRTIVEMHGGTATLHSAGADSGSEFFVSLPAVEAMRQCQDNVAPSLVSSKSGSFLPAEDGKDAKDPLMTLLYPGSLSFLH